ncbi:Holliday junction resolvase RecU [bacterium]|nr:Holliday junction resolvase RecU [bacterium]
MNINKGMYLENLIDKTIKFHYEDEDFFFIKYHTKNAITKTHKFLFISNNFVDYFGSYLNHFFVIEAKQNNQDLFNLKRLNEKQTFILKKLYLMQINCYLILYFNNYDEFYLLDFKYIYNKLLLNQKSIKYSEIKELGIKLELRLPGILNIKETLNKLFK